MNEDWDTAIILDSCRYDIFAEECTIDGELSKAVSPASYSEEFIQRTFEGGTFHDTVYVTGNPYSTRLESDTFYDVKLDDAWEKDETEAPPHRITEAALEAHREYPKKRIIVHYMTPHRPFVADEYRDLNAQLGNWRGMYWPQQTTREEICEAYRANVRVALKHVTMLLEEIEGRVVVTADHGELLGERVFPIPIRMFNHFPSLYVPELIEVPWLEVENGPRRDVVSESPVGSVSVDAETRRKRLEALGYVADG